MKPLTGLLGAFLLLAPAAGMAARLEVSPARVLEGEPVSIRVTDAVPGSQVTLHSQSVIRAGSGRLSQ